MSIIEKAFISKRAGITVVDFLADELPLSKVKIKDAMQKGAVWLQRGDDEPYRLRRAKEFIKLNDEVHIYYDGEFLQYQTPRLTLLQDCGGYSIWIKPAGILDEVSLRGDHLSLEQSIEISLPKERDCYWLYPNSEALQGLLLIAHTRNVAAKFERMELEDGIETDYRVERPTVEAELEQYDEFLLEHENSAKRSKKNQRHVYYFDQAQGKEIDILESFQARIDPRRLEEYPVELECLRLSFICPVAGDAQEFKC